MRLSRIKFEAWLEAKVTEYVGDPNDRTGCALCQFYKASGIKSVMMNIDKYSVNSAPERNATLWMRKFQTRSIIVAKSLGLERLPANLALSIMQNLNCRIKHHP